MMYNQYVDPDLPNTCVLCVTRNGKGTSFDHMKRIWSLMSGGKPENEYEKKVLKRAEELKAQYFSEKDWKPRK